MKPILFALLLLLAAPLAAEPAAALHPGEREAQRLLSAPEPDWVAIRAAFAEAAEAGSPTAMAYLGWIHEMGHGVEVSHPLAVIWYTRAVEAGADHLALKLAWLHLAGQPSVQDRALAERWFQAALAQGDPNAPVAYASVLLGEARQGREVERVGEAHELLRAAHAAGHEVAVFFLAGLYIEGVGEIAPDARKALEYTRIGAEQGHPQMQGWLAWIYHEGRGTEADPIEAAKWALLGTAGGDPEAHRLLSQLRETLSEAQMGQARDRARAWAEP